jgi:hypothetical protein
MPLQRRWAAEEFLEEKTAHTNYASSYSEGSTDPSAERLLAGIKYLSEMDEANTAFNYCCEGDSALVGETSLQARIWLTRYRFKT